MKRTLLNIDLKLLNVFKAVVEQRGLTPAANQLNISVSSVSNQLTDLEHRLGFILCRRGRSGFELTDEGSQVFAAHQSLLEDLAEFNAKIGDIRGSLVGGVKMSIISAALNAPSLSLERAVRNFKKRSDLTTLSVGIQPARVIEQQLIDEEIDIGISIHQRNFPELTEEALSTEMAGLFCGKGHPLFDQDLTEESIEYVMQFERCFRDYIRYSGGARRKKSNVHTADSNELEGVALFVLSGQFLGNLPTEYAAKWVSQGLMKRILPGHFYYKNTIVMLTKANKTHSRVVQAMMQDIRNLIV